MRGRSPTEPASPSAARFSWSTGCSCADREAHGVRPAVHYFHVVFTLPPRSEPSRSGTGGRSAIRSTTGCRVQPHCHPRFWTAPDPCAHATSLLLSNRHLRRGWPRRICSRRKSCAVTAVALRERRGDGGGITHPAHRGCSGALLRAPMPSVTSTASQDPQRSSDAARLGSISVC